MNGRIKVMIAYDGSSHADDAIDDLRRAGLPPDGEALIVSVADVLMTDSLSDFELVKNTAGARRAMPALNLLQEQGLQIYAETRNFAVEAVRRVQSHFPEWKVESEVLRGTPADELLRKAAEWQPDLIVVGSQGRSAIGRFFLGSVSKKIAEKANCSVRVVRRGTEKTNEAPVKILGGASSLPVVERVVRAIGRRVWSAGTEVRLVAVDDGVMPGRVSSVYPDAITIFNQAAEPLVAAGLRVSIDIRDGYLKAVLLQEAENCQADSVFVPADEEYGSNEAAASLITEAKCTTEIVREGARINTVKN